MPNFRLTEHSDCSSLQTKLLRKRDIRGVERSPSKSAGGILGSALRAGLHRLRLFVSLPKGHPASSPCVAGLRHLRAVALREAAPSFSLACAIIFNPPPRPGRCTFERLISDPDERLRLTVFVVLVRQPPKGHPLPHPFGASPSTRCRAPSPTATRSFCRSLHAAPRGFPPPPSARVAPASRFRAFNQHAATDPLQHSATVPIA